MSTPLWLVDRSRIETGTQRCTWERLLNYHFGPSGYGIARKAESIPLTTGIAIHVGTQLLGEWCRQHPHEESVPLEVIRLAVQTAREQYEARARARGLVGWADETRVEEIIGEQSSLIGGLIWCVGLEFLPWLLSSQSAHGGYEVVEVETEEVYVVGCTCGLGDGIGTGEEHEARDCFGVGFMSKPDLLTRARLRPDSYQYWEYKSTGRLSKAWQESWETRVQFHAGIVGAEKRLGIRVDETYVVGLWKGYRDTDSQGVKRQNSVCCYGYYRAPKPPLHEGAWEALWEDKTRTPQKLNWQQWKKTPVWTATFPDQPEGMDSVEYWLRWLPAHVRSQQLAIVGPFNRQDVLIDGFFRELVPAEHKWREGLWALYEAMAANDWQWASPEVQAIVSHHWQRSWACRKFGAEHQCQFVGLCFQKEGWTDPLGGGQFVLRRPHHEPELQAAIASGVIPSDEAEEQEDD